MSASPASPTVLVDLAIENRLRSVRAEVREDVGISYPDPRTGLPMIGTGHCHDTCYAAEDEDLQMVGGWFRHPDGFDYEHSWLQAADGTWYDPTADQWHLSEYPDVTTMRVGDPRRERYVLGQPDIVDGEWAEFGAYLPRPGFTPVKPPADPQQRGIIALFG